MTEAEKEIIRLLNQILLKLPEKERPKYETKVGADYYTDVIWRDPLPSIKSDSHGNILNNNNEKTETED